MDNREIIKQTMANMNLIYSDISQIGKIIEEKMTNNGFNPIGDSTFTWENSNSLFSSDWLYRWFARAYTKNDSLKKVGFCIHLGAYSQEEVKRLPSHLPIMNISLIEPSERDFSGNELRNILWQAGWGEEDSNTTNQCIVKRDSVRTVTYFVDLLSLESGEIIENVVVEPMLKMFDGEEDWAAIHCKSRIISL